MTPPRPETHSRDTHVQHVVSLCHIAAIFQDSHEDFAHRQQSELFVIRHHFCDLLPLKETKKKV